MNPFFKTLLFIAVICLSSCSKKTAQTSHSQKQTTVDFWLTKGDQSVLFQKQPSLAFDEINNEHPTIEINPQKTFQQMDGFGYCLNGGSAQLISKMGKTERDALLKELFETSGSNIGISVLRLSIGASDLDDRVFSYNDLPSGETDPDLKKFSLENDHRTGLIPLLKQILTINPKIQIIASPWSAPTWMKTNNNTKGGSLKPEYYNVYADYFVKYIQEMKREGIIIDGITIQNEPLHPGNNPSMYMEAKDQAIFIKNNLGPAFKKAKLKTKIIIYDHNCDKPEYPLAILNDPEANQYVDGSAFHLYGGKIEAMSTVRDAHPDKNIYFTEQWTGGPGNFPEDLKWNIQNLIVGAPRNWARHVLQWNLAADPLYDPHTDQGGCTSCMGAITIEGSKVTRNIAYYVMAHASKFVRPGAVRVESTTIKDLPNVAYRNSDGKKVIIVLNTNKAEQHFNIKTKSRTINAVLPSGAVGTFIW